MQVRCDLGVQEIECDRAAVAGYRSPESPESLRCETVDERALLYQRGLRDHTQNATLESYSPGLELSMGFGSRRSS